MDEFVSALAAKGALTPEAAKRIEELESGAHLPLARELHSLLYLGAALIITGVGATVKDRLEDIGPMTILAALGLGAAVCIGYCFKKGRPFAPGKVEAPNVAFDYILYLGCGLTGVFFTYLEFKWKLLGDWWDLYLFGSGLLFAALAYRFDNRLVLAAGLMNIAGWFGLRTGRWDWIPGGPRPLLVAYGGALAAAGLATRGAELKPHFSDSYLTLGVHLAFLTLLPDATRFSHLQYWVLLLACGALAAWSFREKRFDTLAAAVGYAYAATLISFLEGLSPGFEAGLMIVVLSSGALIAALLWARSSFKQAAS